MEGKINFNGQSFLNQRVFEGSFTRGQKGNWSSVVEVKQEELVSVEPSWVVAAALCYN